VFFSFQKPYATAAAIGSCNNTTCLNQANSQALFVASDSKVEK